MRGMKNNLKKRKQHLVNVISVNDQLDASNIHSDSCSVFQRQQLQDPFSPIILQNVLSLVLHIFLYLEAFEYNTTSDWLNHTV